MRFIYLHFSDGGLAVINIGAILVVESDSGKVRIEFTAKERAPLLFNYDINEFCNMVFLPDDTELVVGDDGIGVVEVDEDEEPEVTDEMLEDLE